MNSLLLTLDQLHTKYPHFLSEYLFTASNAQSKVESPMAPEQPPSTMSLAEFLGSNLEVPPPVTTQSGADFAIGVLNTHEFRQYIVSGLAAGDLPSAITVRLMDLGWGKPVERVEVKDRTDYLESLTPEAVQQRLERVQRMLQLLRDAQQGDAAQDATTTSVH